MELRRGGSAKQYEKKVKQGYSTRTLAAALQRYEAPSTETA